MTMPMERRNFSSILFGLLLVLSTGTAAVTFHSVLATWGMTAAEWLLLGLYTILVVWIGSSFWICVFGAIRLLGDNRRQRGEKPMPLLHPGPWQHARTAVVMPLYHEEAERALDGLRATYESLEELGAIEAFHFFVLSDSRDPAKCRNEERAWLRLCRDLGAGGRLFLRRRKCNTGKKAGNIQEFCERWGRCYDYMIILDADSIMAGETILDMMRRMEAEERLGLLQAWPTPVNGRSLFARVQQFAANVQGRLIAAGLSVLMEPCGTYWGHNAIIRVEAFMQSCGLPRLSGRPPLGGEILSHDFVEAALLLRRGWRIRIMVDGEGSYEEGPPNLIEHMNRDRRWCQGNLQHARLILTEGFKFPSRMNFVMGVLSYAASPLWLAFMMLAVVVAAQPLPFHLEALRAWLMSMNDHGVPSHIPWLIGLTVTLLLGPKALGLLLGVVDAERRRASGGAAALCASIVLEVAVTALIAPLMMLMHAEFVATTLAGYTTKWDAQQRDTDAIKLRDAARLLGPRCAVGATLAAMAAWWAPALIFWMLPLLVSFVVAIPLVVLSSREHKERGPARLPWLFRTPPETMPSPVLSRLRSVRALRGRRRLFHVRQDDPLEAEVSLLLGRGPAS
nr:glucans biosynthesis glucosyltransferase MdoH [Ferruginivarius sediminum]